jgi:hypothetical protein
MQPKRASMLRICLPLVLIACASVTTACHRETSGESAGGGDTSSAATTSPATTAPADEKTHVADRLGPAPKNCTGPAPDLVSFDDYGNLAGGSPVWAGIYASFDPAGQRYRIERDAPRNEYGWRIKVLWVVGPTLGESARITGRELRRGASLWFEVEDQDIRPATEATLEPAADAVMPSRTGYTDFPSYVYVPRSGCYALEAEWADGGWRLVFGLGR